MPKMIVYQHRWDEMPGTRGEYKIGYLRDIEHAPLREFKGRPFANFHHAHQRKNSLRWDARACAWRRVTERVPPCVTLPYRQFTVRYGICDRVRTMPPECEELLATMDESEQYLREQLAALERQRQEVLEDGYARGTPIREKKIINFTPAMREGEKK